MLAVISPAKTIDFERQSATSKFTEPQFLDYSEKLAGRLKKMSPRQLAKLMNISPALAELNFTRYQQWHLPFTNENAKQAVIVFNGEVYRGLDATSLSEKSLLLSQSKLRILSGLYGVLKPLDLIQAYRLEMGIPLKYYRSKDLYAFWKPIIYKKIREALDESGSNVLVNLASSEYFKSIDSKKLKAEIVTPEFKDLKNGSYKMITVFAKRARGLMTRFIIENDITRPDDLLAFDAEGYGFNPRLSQNDKLVFTRDH